MTTDNIVTIAFFYVLAAVGAFAIIEETPPATVKYPRLVSLGLAIVWPATMVLIGTLVVSLLAGFALDNAIKWIAGGKT